MQAGEIIQHLGYQSDDVSESNPLIQLDVHRDDHGVGTSASDLDEDVMSQDRMGDMDKLMCVGCPGEYSQDETGHTFSAKNGDNVMVTTEDVMITTEVHNAEDIVEYSQDRVGQRDSFMRMSWVEDHVLEPVMSEQPAAGKDDFDFSPVLKAMNTEGNGRDHLGSAREPSNVNMVADNMEPVMLVQPGKVDLDVSVLEPIMTEELEKDHIHQMNECSQDRVGHRNSPKSMNWVENGVLEPVMIDDPETEDLDSILELVIADVRQDDSIDIVSVLEPTMMEQLGKGDLDIGPVLELVTSDSEDLGTDDLDHEDIASILHPVKPEEFEPDDSMDIVSVLEPGMTGEFGNDYLDVRPVWTEKLKTDHLDVASGRTVMGNESGEKEIHSETCTTKDREAASMDDATLVVIAKTQNTGNTIGVLLTDSQESNGNGQLDANVENSKEDLNVGQTDDVSDFLHCVLDKSAEVTPDRFIEDDFSQHYQDLNNVTHDEPQKMVVTDREHADRTENTETFVVSSVCSAGVLTYSDASLKEDVLEDSVEEGKEMMKDRDETDLSFVTMVTVDLDGPGGSEDVAQTDPLDFDLPEMLDSAVTQELGEHIREDKVNPAADDHYCDISNRRSSSAVSARAKKRKKQKAKMEKYQLKSAAPQDNRRRKFALSFRELISRPEDQFHPDFTCPVCLDLYHRPHVISPCQHMFCEPCLRKLPSSALADNAVCPLCRCDIRGCSLDVDLHLQLSHYYSHLYSKRARQEKKLRTNQNPLPRIYNTPLTTQIIRQIFRNSQSQRRNPTNGLSVFLAVCMSGVLSVLYIWLNIPIEITTGPLRNAAVSNIWIQAICLFLILSWLFVKLLTTCTERTQR